MMEIKCIIIDDEPIARMGMQEYIGQVDFLTVAGVFERPQQVPALSDDIGLIFLDIEMPGITGTDFVRSLKAPPLIIFTTAYPDYALEGYELDVVDYLVKPIALPRFLKAVNKAKDMFIARHEGNTAIARTGDHFFVKENGKFVRVFYDEILFAEALQNYVAIHLPGRKLISYITLSVLEKQFPADRFIRIHKSYIISLSKISSIGGNFVMVGATRVPVSRKIKDQLMQKVLHDKLLKRPEGQ